MGSSRFFAGFFLSRGGCGFIQEGLVAIGRTGRFRGIAHLGPQSFQFDMQLFNRLCRERIIVKILLFQRIPFPIEQFPVVDIRFMVMYQFIAVGNHPVVGPNLMRGGVFVVAIIEAGSPVGWGGPSAEWHQTAALHFGQRLLSGDFEEGLSQVE